MKKHNQKFTGNKRTGNSSAGSSRLTNSMAPYNFVPLNKKVVPAEEIPSFDRYHTDRFTGYIDLEIKTLTPLYIRDTLTMDEYSRKERENYINPDFFSPGNLPRIPGSSLRGMLRTLVEIVSYGKFQFFDKDRKFHFRSFADKSLDLRKEYADVMIEGNAIKGYHPTVKAGYLIKRGLDYFIRPAKLINDTQYFRIEEDDAIKSGVIKEKMKKIRDYVCRKDDISKNAPGNCDKCNKPLTPRYKANENYKPGFKLIKFIPSKPVTHTHHSVPYYYAKVDLIWNIDDTSAPPNAINGTLVLSKWVGSQKEGKHLHWIIGPEDDTKEFKIDRNVIVNYKNDQLRDKDCNLFEYFKKDKDAHIPCFYIEKDGKIISFGHTGMFRLAYKKELKEFIYKELVNFSGIDIPTAIFGNESDHAGRVFFEDAYLKTSEINFLDNPAYPKILSSPKPTAFQHYLEQDIKNIKIDERGNIEGLKTYNSNTVIRGYKLYWHRDGKDWVETDSENINKHHTQYTKINPVKEGVIFQGKIRFENLSKVELGALLFVLNLPEGCAHKIGMAKPLGLGSVKINPTLYLSDRKKRYTELFSEWEASDGVSSEKVKDFISAFEKYVLEKLGEKKTSLWELDRLKELKRMLSWADKPDNSKTEYLPLSEFRKRNILPPPSKV